MMGLPATFLVPHSSRVGRLFCYRGHQQGSDQQNRESERGKNCTVIILQYYYCSVRQQQQESLPTKLVASVWSIYALNRGHARARSGQLPAGRQSPRAGEQDSAAAGDQRELLLDRAPASTSNTLRCEVSAKNSQINRCRDRRTAKPRRGKRARRHRQIKADEA